MATVINEIRTKFSTSGANAVARDAERVGRTQTRLGNASTNASRAFAAQSSGLGGLVAAYAGAAATAFALEAAFTSLANAARAIETFQGLNTLAAASAESADRVLASIRRITNAQLTLVEAAQQANLSLSAGFSFDQIEGISEVAIKASRALGRDLTDAYTRVVRGAAKMETELLDELGIYTKIEPATRAYADAIGVSVTALSEFQRRQAFVNAVISEGLRKYASINTTVPTAAEKIEAFGTRILDLGTQLGGFFATSLAPLADFLTNNLAATLGTLGALAGLALGKAISEINKKLDKFKENIEGRVSRASDIAQRFNAAQAIAATSSVADINLSKTGLTGNLQSELGALRELARERKLTVVELKKAESLLSTRQANLANKISDIKNEIRQQRALARASAEGSIAFTQATAAIATKRKELEKIQPLLTATTAQMTALGAATTGAASSFGVASAAVTNFALRGLAAAANAALNLVGLAGTLVTVASIVGIFGTAIAEATGNGEAFNAWIASVGATIRAVFSNERAQQAQNVFLGAATNILESLEEVDSNLRELDSFTFTTSKFLGIEFDVTKTKEQLISEVSEILGDVAAEGGRSLGDSIASGWSQSLGGLGAVVGTGVFGALGAAGGPVGVALGGTAGTVIGGAIGAAIGTSIDYFLVDSFAIDDATRARLTAQFASALTGATPQVQEQLLQALAAVEREYGRAAAVDPAAAAALDLQQQIVVASREYLENIDAVANIIAASGQNAISITANYDFVSPEEELNSIFSEAITTIENIPITFRFINLDNDALQEALAIPGITGIVDRSLPADLFIPTLSGNRTEEFAQRLADDVNSRLSAAISNNLQTFLSLAEQANQYLRQDTPLTEDNFRLMQRGLTQSARRMLNSLVPVNAEIETIEAFLRELFSSVGNLDLSRPFYEASTAINSTNQSAIRAVEVLRTLSDGIASSAIDYEQYQQAITNSSTALIDSRRDLVEIDERLATLAERRASVTLGSEQATVIDSAIVNLLQSRETIEGTIVSAERLLGVMRDMEDSLKNQLDLNRFLLDVTPQRTNAYQMEFDIITASGRSPAEAMQEIADRTVSAGDAYRAFTEATTQSISDIGLQLNEGELSSILSLNTSNIESRLGYLREIKGITDVTLSADRQFVTVQQRVTDELGQQRDLAVRINLLSLEQFENGRLNEGILEAQNEILRQSIPELLNIIKNRQEIVAELQREVELSNLQRAIDSDSSALESRRVAIEEIVSINQLNIDVLTQALELEERIADVQRQESQNRISAIETEIRTLESYQDYIDSQFTRASDLLSSGRTFVDLDSALRTSSAIAGEGTEEQVAQRVAAIRVDAATTAFRLDLEAAALRQAQAEDAADRDLLIAQSRLRIADEELSAAKQVQRNNARAATARLELLQAEQSLELQKIRNAIEIDAITLRNQESVDALRMRQLEIERDQNQQKIADEYRLLQATATLLDQKRAADSTYLTELAAIVSAQTGQSLSTSDLPTISFGGEIDSLIADLNAAYDTIYENARATAEQQSIIESRRLALSIDNNRILLAATEFLQTETTNIVTRENAARAESDRLAVVEAIRSQDRARQAVTQANQRITDVASSSSNEVVQAYAQATNRIISEANNAVEQFNSSMRSIVSGINAEIEQITQRERILSLQFEIETANLEAQLNELILSQNLEALRLQVELVNAQENAGTISGQQAADQLTSLEERMLAGRRELLDLEYQNQMAAFDRQENLIAEQLAIDLQNIKNERQLAAADIQARTQTVQDQIEGYKQLISGLTSIFNSFGESFRGVLDSFGNNLVTALNSIISALGTATGSGLTGISGWGGVEFTEITNRASEALGALSTSVADTAETALASVNERAERQTQATATAAARETALIAQRRQIAERTHQNAVANLGTEGIIQQQNAIARQNQLDEEAGKIEEIANRVADMQQSFESSIQSAFMGLNDLLFYGEGTIEEVIGGLFRSIQETVFEKTIAEPLARWLSESLTGWIYDAVGGVDIMGNPLASALPDAVMGSTVATAGGPAVVTSVGQGAAAQINTATQTVTTALQGMGTRIQGAAQSASAGLQTSTNTASVTMQTSGQQMASAATTVGTGVGQAATTASSTMLSSMWILLPLLLLLGLGGGGSRSRGASEPNGTVTTITEPRSVQMASGGMVQLASGGMLRDRVPALLEPGEFVIRRPAARKLGENALQSMNATGKTEGSAPIINVNNQGSGKAVERTDITFDGDKYIIDLVLNDLNNNGPIRRALRSGAV